MYVEHIRLPHTHSQSEDGTKALHIAEIEYTCVHNICTFIEFQHDALHTSQDDSQKLYSCSFVTVSDLVSDNL